MAGQSGHRSGRAGAWRPRSREDADRQLLGQETEHAGVATRRWASKRVELWGGEPT